jgi:hypothetical protein
MSVHNLSAKTVPDGTEFPGSVQGLIDLLAQYMDVVGGETIIGINFGSTTPNSENRSRPWFKTTAGGAPVGWYSWNGSDWGQTPLAASTGGSTARPVSPSAGTQYFDTTINAAIIFERGKWRTLSGSPGDIKFVNADTLAAAITKNPGWIEFADATGRVIGAAGVTSGLSDRAILEKAGEEETILTLAQLPRFTPKVTFTMSSNYTQTGPNIEGAPGTEQGTKTLSGPSIGEGVAHSNMQPTLFAWCLTKE